MTVYFIIISSASDFKIEFVRAKACINHWSKRSKKILVKYNISLNKRSVFCAFCSVLNKLAENVELRLCVRVHYIISRIEKSNDIAYLLCVEANNYRIELFIWEHL